MLTLSNVLAAEACGLTILTFLPDSAMASLKQVCRMTHLTLNRFLANYICTTLCVDRSRKKGIFNVILTEDPTTLRVQSCRANVMDMIQAVIRLRPDIETLIID